MDAGIREARDEDAAGVVDLFNEVLPTWIHTEAGWLHRRATQGEQARRLSLVAEQGGRIVGTGSGSMHYEAARPGVAWIGVWVREASRGRGIGGGLYARAEQHVRANGARRLLTTTHDDETSRRFAASRGFRHTHTERTTAVDPRTVDLAAFAALAAEKADEGFKVVPMAEVRPEEVFAVDMEATHDIPMDEPPTKSRFDQWEAKHWRHPDLSLDASQVVVDRERRVVSFAMVSVDQARRRAANEMTGTLRRFRGRRLARLAKLATIAWAVDNGITQILTGNDVTNAPMLAINASLGYRPVASELSWVRDL